MFFYVSSTTELYTLSLHDALPILEVSATQSFAASRTDFDSPWIGWATQSIRQTTGKIPAVLPNFGGSLPNDVFSDGLGDRKSTRLNSSHANISYAVFCLKKKKETQ